MTSSTDSRLTTGASTSLISLQSGAPVGLGVPDGGLRTVVAVGDVLGRDGLEQMGEGGKVGLVGDFPDRMADPVVGVHVALRRGSVDLINQGINGGNGSVDEEYRFGIGRLRGDVPAGVVRLDLPWIFMALDPPFFAVLHRAEAHQLGLGMVTEVLLVDVQAGIRLLEQDAVLDHLVEVPGALGVDFVRVDVSVGWQVVSGCAMRRKEWGFTI